MSTVTMRRTKWIVLAITSALLLMVMLIAWQRHQKEQRYREDCLVHIKGPLLCAMSAYATDRDGMYPNDLATLVDEGYLTIKGPYWLCPKHRKRVPITPDDLRQGRCDYTYLGKGVRFDTADARKTVVLYGDPTNHHNWLSVGFASGHVEGVEAATISEAVAANGWILPEPTLGPAPVPRE